MSASVRVIRLQLEESPQAASGTLDGHDAARAEVLQQAVSDYEAMLLGYAQSFLGEWELARDVVQDTFIKLHRELKTEEPANLKAWLFTVCRNRALDILRKSKRVTVTDTEILECEGDDRQPAPDQLVERQDSHQRALRLLNKLPKNQQEVIRLKFQSDLSYKEISAVTQLSVGNVGYLLHHGLKRLRELMQEPTENP